MKYVTRGVMNALKPKLLSEAGKELEANGEYLFFLKYGLTPNPREGTNLLSFDLLKFSMYSYRTESAVVTMSCPLTKGIPLVSATNSVFAPVFPISKLVNSISWKLLFLAFH